MELKVKYSNLEDKEKKVKQYEAQNLTMKHDNFDPNWKRGDEPYGTMIFTDVAPPTSPPPKPLRDFGAEIDKLNAKIAILEKAR